MFPRGKVKHRKRSTFDIVQDIITVIAGIILITMAIFISGDVLTRRITGCVGLFCIIVGISPMKK